MYRLCLSFLIFMVSTMSAFGGKLEITIKGEGANGIVVIGPEFRSGGVVTSS